MGCRTFMNRHSPGVASCVGSWITTKNKDFLKFNRNVSGTPHLTDNSAGSNDSGHLRSRRSRRLALTQTPLTPGHRSVR